MSNFAMKNFSEESYQKDTSWHKQHAVYWGKDDYKSLIYSNMRGHSECKRVKKDGEERIKDN